MHDVSNQLINAWRMFRASLHTSPKYEPVVSQLSSGEIIRPITDSRVQLISVTASVPETSVSSKNGTVFHTFNPRGSWPFPESATWAISHSQNRVTESFSAD